MTTFNHVTITNKLMLLLFSLALLSQNTYEAKYVTHTSFHVSSLISSSHQDSICNSSPKESRGPNGPTSVRLTHKHGACSTLNSETVARPTDVEILEHDKERVESIRQQLRPNKLDADKVRVGPVGLPTKSGSTIGSGNFIVTIGLGTPKKDLSLVFDTGSDFTWTQCAPCVKSCYEQQEPIFNPSESSTYSNITCSSQLCSEVREATSALPGCSSSTCIYGIQYGDSSFSIGFFAEDRLSLGTGAYVPNFYFGCGENNQGLFGGSAGLLGLGRNKLSVVSQSASTFGNYFSYCLPSTSSSTGHLTFGKGGMGSKMIKYTPLLTNSAGPSFYYIDLQSITVGGHKLAISPTVFLTGGTLIDSGTVITRLPPDAYTTLKDAFKAAMGKYAVAPSLSILDTCYDLSSYTTVTVPKISLLFRGRTSLDLPVSGILYVRELSQVCLAFAANVDVGDVGDVGIIGNFQQMSFDVIYDVAGGELGFGAGGCH